MGTSGPSVEAGVVANPATNKIYQTNSSDNTVSVIDGATNVATTVAVGAMPAAIAANPVTDQVYVLNAGDHTVTVIDGATNATSTVTVGNTGVSSGGGIAVNPVTDKIYVTDSFENSVYVIDGPTRLTIEVPVGTTPIALAVNAVTNKIYVVNAQDTTGTVTVIDGATNTTTTVIVGTTSDTFGAAIAVNPVTNKIYVTDSATNTITVIDGITRATTTVTVGMTPVAIAVNPITNKIYVVNAQDTTGTVTVIDGATNATSTVTVGSTNVSLGTAIGVNLATNKIYVTDSAVNTVTEIDAPANTTTTVMAGANPVTLGVNLATSRVYVVNSPEANATVIAEERTQPVPLVTTIAPIPGGISNSMPVFTFTAASTFAPDATTVEHVYFQVDTWEGPWIAATPGAGNFTGTPAAALLKGTHIVYAYATDGQESNSTGPTQQLIGPIAAGVFTVIPPTTTTTLSSNENPAGTGDTVTFTAAVTSMTAGTITGTVEFFDGGTALGSGTVTAGAATFATAALAVGSHSIIALYSGDPNFAPSDSAALTEVIATPNPVPTVTSISPTSAIAPGAAFTLTVNGTNFIASSVVRWNGVALTTTFVSATQLTAAVPAADVASGASVPVTVFNPAPDGGTSPTPQTFTVNNPAPVLTAISPSTQDAGGAAFTLTLTGSNFVSGSVVDWNGTALTTTFGSGTQLTAAVPASDIATAGSASVTVVNPTPGGGTSSPRTLTIVNPVPVVGSQGTVAAGTNPTAAAVNPGDQQDVRP